ncbi:MAG: hypothetical protein ACRCU9_10825 [Iodobacter sp.]
MRQAEYSYPLGFIPINWLGGLVTKDTVKTKKINALEGIDFEFILALL